MLGHVCTWLAALEDVEPPTTYTPIATGGSLRVLSTLRGSARFEAASGSMQIGKGSIVILAPEWTYHRRINTDIWHHRSLLLRGPWAERLVRSCTAGALLLPRPAPAWRTWIGDAVERTLALRPGWDAAVAARLAQLAEALAEPPADDLVGNLSRAVAAEPERTWRVAELAALSGRSVSGFAHRFREEVGESPARWLLRQRVERACRLLALHPPGEVADLLGFANPYHFSRAFRRISGETPSDYRRRLGSLAV